MNPYNKLFEERIIFLGVQIDDASANDVMAQLLTLESMDPDRDISIYINSPGGSFTALTAIYDTMQFVRPTSRPSASARRPRPRRSCWPAGTPGKRFALPNARVLIHQPVHRGRRPGQSTSRSRPARSCGCAPLEEILARHTAQLEQVRKDIERDKILTAEEAQAYGLVDQIIPSRKKRRRPSPLRGVAAPDRYPVGHVPVRARPLERSRPDAAAE